MMPHIVHTMRGPNVGTGTSSGQSSALKTTSRWQCQQPRWRWTVIACPWPRRYLLGGTEEAPSGGRILAGSPAACWAFEAVGDLAPRSYRETWPPGSGRARNRRPPGHRSAIGGGPAAATMHREVFALGRHEWRRSSAITPKPRTTLVVDMTIYTNGQTSHPGRPQADRADPRNIPPQWCADFGRRRLGARYRTNQRRWQILGAIALEGRPLTVAQIARRMGISRQAVQRVADRLRDAGLTEYQENRDHKRAHLVMLTERGTFAYAEADSRQTAWVNALGKGLDAKAIDEAIGLLRTIHDRCRRKKGGNGNTRESD
jgi:DNA-binding MarR family transcriptional regulator